MILLELSIEKYNLFSVNTNLNNLKGIYFMKKNLNFMLLLWCSVVCFTACSTNDINTVGSDAVGEFALRNELVEVSVNKAGELVTLKNLSTGHNYASGNYLWRMYYDTHGEREIEVLGSGQQPDVTCDGKSIVLDYNKLIVRGNEVDMALRLTITLEGDVISSFQSCICLQ